MTIDSLLPRPSPRARSGVYLNMRAAHSVSNGSLTLPWTAEQVSDLLRKESGQQFDPELVDIALELQGYFRSVRERFAGEHA